MFSTLLMGGGGHTREKDHQNVKSLIIFAHDCRSNRHKLCFYLGLAYLPLTNYESFAIQSLRHSGAHPLSRRIYR